MVSPNGFGSPHRPGIIKSKGQLFKESTLRMGELERERDAARAMVEKIKMMLAQRQVAINALGEKFDVTPEAMRDIINEYMDRKEVEYQKLTDDAKKKYMEGVRSGTAPDFKVIANPDKESNVEPFKPEGQ
jgi:hypothetical protein